MDSTPRLSNMFPIAMSVVAAFFSLVVGVMLFNMESTRDKLEGERVTLHEIRAHKQRIDQLDSGYACMQALLRLPKPTANEVRGYKAPSRGLTCGKSWCGIYRRCLGESVESPKDGEFFTISEADAWHVAKSAQRVIVSFDMIGRFACRGVLDKDIVLDNFELELGRGHSTVVRYIATFYEPRRASTALPGITGLIGSLMPITYSDWAGKCPRKDPPVARHRKGGRLR